MQGGQSGTHPPRLEPGDRCLAGSHSSCQVALAQTSRLPGRSDALTHLGGESCLRVGPVILRPFGRVHGLSASLAHFRPCRPRHRSASSAVCPSLMHLAIALLARAISPCSLILCLRNSVSRTIRRSPAKKYVIRWEIGSR